MTIKSSSFLGALGLIIGVLGVLGPIGWDYYKTKSEIELQLVDLSPIIEKSKRVEGLQVTYAGVGVDELSKATFRIRNSGRTPILKKDVVSPLYIQFPKDSKVVEARVLESRPKDLDALALLSKADARVTVDFSLLNPGDGIWISILTQSTSVKFDAGARIAGISKLVIAPNATLVTKSTGRISWTVYPVGIFSLLVAIAAVIGLRDSRREFRVKNAIRGKTFSLPHLKSRDGVQSYINSKFSFTLSKELAPLLKLIDSLPDSDDFTATHHDAILRGIEDLLDRAVQNLPIAIGAFLVSGFGFWYILAQI